MVAVGSKIYFEKSEQIALGISQSVCLNGIDAFKQSIYKINDVQLPYFVIYIIVDAFPREQRIFFLHGKVLFKKKRFCKALT